MLLRRSEIERSGCWKIRRQLSKSALPMASAWSMASQERAWRLPGAFAGISGFSGAFFLTRRTVCLSFPMRKFSSRADSVSTVSKSGMTMSASASPKWCSLSACWFRSVVWCNDSNSRFRSRIFAKVSMMAKVAAVALGLFSTVASR